MVLRPLQDRCAGELGAVVGDAHGGSSAHGDDGIKLSCDPHARERGIFSRQKRIERVLNNEQPREELSDSLTTLLPVPGGEPIIGKTSWEIPFCCTGAAQMSNPDIWPDDNPARAEIRYERFGLFISDFAIGVGEVSRFRQVWIHVRSLPAPEQAKAAAVPTHECLRLEDDCCIEQCREPPE